MKTMRNQLTVLLLAVAYGTLAHACLPANKRTLYFGDWEYVDDDLDTRITQDIAKNHYHIIEGRVGLRYFPIIKKGDAIYLDNAIIATKEDSFAYLGHGYYQLNRELYYMGKHVGKYPREGSVFTWSEDRHPSKPDNFPPNVMYCSASRHADILETSDGLHVENLAYDS